MQSLQGIKGFDKEAFEKIHASDEQVTSIRINPFKLSESSQVPSFGGPAFRPCSAEALAKAQQAGLGESIPWTQYGFYLTKRPSFTFDPLFHAGCFYVQEASSMFLEQALKQNVDLSLPVRILDLSAAPGGKSTHIQSLISTDSLLVSNEVIRSRANVLKDNIIKWGAENVVVTNNDPADFQRLENFFDIIVIDAPCSGSGLFRRDPESAGEWSENNLALCSQRQQRILADVFPSLKSDGLLIYSTCSYSREEDEDIIDWMTKEFNVEGLKLIIDENWNITETKGSTGTYGYRFWPDKVKGEGFFIACFRRNDGEYGSSFKTKVKAEEVTRKEMEVIEKWVNVKDHHIIKNENTVYAWPDSLTDDMNVLLSRLRVIYSGVRLGGLMKDKLVPDHALGMSKLVNQSAEKIALNYDQAIHYLQRKDLKIETRAKGWNLVTYQGHPLGWVNVLPNRINNYYPKELRILKDR